MNERSVWHYLPPPGPLLSLLLIGMVLLSGLLYYRAVKIQRFLEPALALSQPRNEFTNSIGKTFEKEFGPKTPSGLRLKSSSILVEKSLLYSGGLILNLSARDEMQKLARIFLTLMKDEKTRSEISLVLIIARFPSYGGARGGHNMERIEAQRMMGLIQDALFQEQPELGVRYPHYFAAVAQATSPHEPNRNSVEFRIVPSEFLHIEVLERLQKYSY